MHLIGVQIHLGLGFLGLHELEHRIVELDLNLESEFEFE